MAQAHPIVRTRLVMMVVIGTNGKIGELTNGNGGMITSSNGKQGTVMNTRNDDGLQITAVLVEVQKVDGCLITIPRRPTVTVKQICTVTRSHGTVLEVHVDVDTICPEVRLFMEIDLTVPQHHVDVRRKIHLVQIVQQAPEQEEVLQYP